MRAHPRTPTHTSLQSRARDSPVIVVATHTDRLPPSWRSHILRQLQLRFQELYVEYNTSSFAYPRFLDKQCHFVSCQDNNKMDAFRDYIYDFVTTFNPESE